MKCALPVLAFALLCALVGCTSGPPKFVVKGKVTDNGTPLEVKPMVGKLQVYLMQQEVAGAVDKHHAVIKSDGTFEIKGAGTGIPAGKYKVCVIWQDEFPAGPDKLDGKFNEQNSPILRKVPEDGDIVIDVSK